MHVAHLRQVLHARGDAPKHAHQLDGSELAVVQLQGRRAGGRRGSRGEVDGGEVGRGRQGGEWGEEEGVQGRRKEEENEG